MLEGVEVSATTIRFNWREKSLSITDVFVGLDDWANDNGRVVVI